MALCGIAAAEKSHALTPVLSSSVKENNSNNNNDSNKSDVKLYKLIDQATSALQTSGELDIWRAYVCVEYAILDLKLRYNIQEQTLNTDTIITSANPAVKQTGRKGTANEPKSRKRQVASEDHLGEVKARIQNLDLDQDRKILLQELRSCRDILKALASQQW
jgi:hypothetical protein